MKFAHLRSSFSTLTLLKGVLLLAALSGVSACKLNKPNRGSDGKSSARYGLIPGSRGEQFVVGASYQWRSTLTHLNTQSISYQKMTVLKVTQEEITLTTFNAPTPVFLPGMPGETKAYRLSDGSCVNTGGMNPKTCALSNFIFTKTSGMVIRDLKTVLAGAFQVFEVASPLHITHVCWGDETSGPLRGTLIYATFPTVTYSPSPGPRPTPPPSATVDGTVIELMSYQAP
ncbi:MAG: hypothetical protein H7222_06150 [Methylotenera sp.]|nr:hypothetical protein [Oligoflexia bacterium]